MIVGVAAGGGKSQTPARWIRHSFAKIRHPVSFRRVIGARLGYPDTKRDFAAHWGDFAIKVLRRAGISSSMCYTAGLASIGLSIASWFTSRNLESKGIARADRWGIFVGQWAPTFFALGNAMRMEEEMAETRPSERVEEMKARAREKMPTS